MFLPLLVISEMDSVRKQEKSQKRDQLPVFFCFGCCVLRFPHHSGSGERERETDQKMINSSGNGNKNLPLIISALFPPF
jgi:hypothetical protein